MTTGHSANSTRSVQTIVEAHRNLLILHTLREIGKANGHMLRDIVEMFGALTTMSQLRETVDLLEREGLVRTEDIEGMLIVRLAAKGEDVALGRVSNQWVAAPEFGDEPSAKSWLP